jgi:DNA-binding XRE family transcriptional regulator
MEIRHERSLIFCEKNGIISIRVIDMKEYNFNKNIKSVICQNIKKYRNEKNVRLMDLAEAVDVTPDHLKRIESENDRNNISLTTLYKISIVLDVSIEKFFEE